MRYELSEIAPLALAYAQKNDVSFWKAANQLLPQYGRKRSQKNIKLLIEKMEDMQEMADLEEERAEAEYCQRQMAANEHIVPIEG